MKINEKIKLGRCAVGREIGKFFRDILRDKNSSKYSITSTIGLVGVILLCFVVKASIDIMIKKQEIDHVLMVELIGLILTVLGFKNSFGFIGKSNGDQQITTDSTNDTLTREDENWHRDQRGNPHRENYGQENTQQENTQQEFNQNEVG